MYTSWKQNIKISYRDLIYRNLIFTRFSLLSFRKSIFRLNFGKRNHCGADGWSSYISLTYTRTGLFANGAFETTAKARKRGKEIEPWPAARLTSRMYQLKAGWRQQAVWKTQGTKYGDRKPARGNSPLRVRGRNSINYELAWDPLTTVRHRGRARHTLLLISAPPPPLCHGFSPPLLFLSLSLVCRFAWITSRNS